MKEGIFLLLIFLSIISVCQNHQTSYGYSEANRKRYNYACVNAVAVANRAFYQLANNLRHQINQDVIYSDLDSIYGLSYYLDSTCSEDELTLRVQGGQNPACRKLFKLINLSLNQHGLDSFVNDYEKGINLSLQALKLGRSLNNDCKIKLVQKREYDYDFNDLDSLDVNINKEISKSDKYYAPSDDDLDLDLGDEDDLPVVLKPKSTSKGNKPKKPSQNAVVSTSSSSSNITPSSVTSPSPKGETPQSPQEKPSANSWFPQKSDAGFGFLGSQNSPSLSAGSSSSGTPSFQAPGGSSQAGFGQSVSFMGNSANGQSSTGGGAQNGASQYYSQYYQAGGDPSDYNKYIQGSNAETQKDPSLLAAYHQNLAKTLNDESKNKYAGDSPDYSSQWQQYVGNYTSNSSSSSGQQGGQTFPYGDYQKYEKYNNDHKDKDEDEKDEDLTQDAENGEYSSDFLEDNQDQDQDQDDDSDSQDFGDLKDEFYLLF